MQTPAWPKTLHQSTSNKRRFAPFSSDAPPDQKTTPAAASTAATIRIENGSVPHKGAPGRHAASTESRGNDEVVHFATPQRSTLNSEKIPGRGDGRGALGKGFAELHPGMVQTYPVPRR